MKNLKALALEEQGQGLTEYGFMLAFISLVLVAVMQLVGNSIANLYQSIQAIIKQ